MNKQVAIVMQSPLDLTLYFNRVRSTILSFKNVLLDYPDVYSWFFSYQYVELIR